LAASPITADSDFAVFGWNATLSPRFAAKHADLRKPAQQLGRSLANSDGLSVGAGPAQHWPMIEEATP
jgi:hypothetical protein